MDLSPMKIRSEMRSRTPQELKGALRCSTLRARDSSGRFRGFTSGRNFFLRLFLKGASAHSPGSIKKWH